MSDSNNVDNFGNEDNIIIENQILYDYYPTNSQTVNCRLNLATIFFNVAGSCGLRSDFPCQRRALTQSLLADNRPFVGEGHPDHTFEDRYFTFKKPAKFKNSHFCRSLLNSIRISEPRIFPPPAPKSTTRETST